MKPSLDCAGAVVATATASACGLQGAVRPSACRGPAAAPVWVASGSTALRLAGPTASAVRGMPSGAWSNPRNDGPRSARLRANTGSATHGHRLHTDAIRTRRGHSWNHQECPRLTSIQGQWILRRRRLLATFAARADMRRVRPHEDAHGEEALLKHLRCRVRTPRSNRLPAAGAASDGEGTRRVDQEREGCAR
eukprot:COSAG06_NODE_19173_length_850_cov_1.756325_2_plen_193_part_00